MQHILCSTSLKRNAAGRTKFEVINDISSEQKSSGSGVNPYAQVAQQPQQVGFIVSFHG